MKSPFLPARFPFTIAAALVSSAALNPAHAAVLVEAHRGDSINAPENTLASITSLGGIADLTEFDVRVSADGELVLMHDATLDRTTNGTGPVSGQTLAQLQALDAGSWFSPAFAGEQIPMMTEAMNASFAAGITPLVERKAGTAAQYHSVFNTQGFSASTFSVISFDWAFIDDLDALDANYHLGVLGFGVLDQSRINDALAQGADFIDWRHTNITATEVDLVHANGLELHVWTVNDDMRMQELIALGVDGITTDDPHLLATLVPEPNSLALLVAGGVFVVRRRRRA